MTVSGCSGRESVKSSYAGTGSMDETQVTHLLNQNGYRNITNLHKNGSDWVGSADKDGASLTFDIDKDGQIHGK